FKTTKSGEAQLPRTAAARAVRIPMHARPAPASPHICRRLRILFAISVSSRVHLCARYCMIDHMRAAILLTLNLALLGIPSFSSGPAEAPEFSEADRLRVPCGPYPSNNDLLYYHVDGRDDPERQFLSGKNTIRFKM